MDQTNRETEKILVSVRRATLLMDPMVKLAATGTVLLLTYIARMVKEGKLKRKDFKSVEEFFKLTEGKYTIQNIPVSSEELGMVQSELDRIGIRYAVLPDLNKEDGFLQIAVYNADKEKFAGYLERYYASHMLGGAKELRSLNNLTSGKTTIISIPVEGKEERMIKDFEAMGINYSSLPDLTVGDGQIQVVVANMDVPKVEYWFKLYKEDQLAEGKETGDLQKVSMNQYVATGHLTEEGYIDTATDDFVKANEKYEGNEPGEIEKAVGQRERNVKPVQDEEYENFRNDPDYQAVTINRETLVEKSQWATNARFEEAGMFASRIPGTWGEKELTLVLPKENVFVTSDKKTYIAFVNKNAKPIVMNADGDIVHGTKRLTGRELHLDYYEKWDKLLKKKVERVAPDMKEPMKNPTVSHHAPMK